MRPVQAGEISTFDNFATNLVNFLLDELVLLAARELLRRRVRDLELAALLLGDAELRLRLSRLSLVSLVRLHRRVELVQHPKYLLVRLVTDFTTLKRVDQAVDVLVVRVDND